jgi:hypothetical protein
MDSTGVIARQLEDVAEEIEVAQRQRCASRQKNPKRVYQNGGQETKDRLHGLSFIFNVTMTLRSQSQIS